MKREHISDAVGHISPEFIQEAADYSPAQKRRPISWKAVLLAAAVTALLIAPAAAYAVDTVRFNAAVEYLRSRGIDVTDRSDYSREDIVMMADKAKEIDAYKDMEAQLEAQAEEYMASPPPARPTEPADVTSDQVRQLGPTMTWREVTDLLGDTVDVGSGLFILEYRVDGAYSLYIPFAGLDAQLGVTGEELLLMLGPIP